eukprot:2170193-Lingulodinium_polyedra.AAC.1
METHVPEWHLDLFERLFLALEHDMMGNRSLREKIVLKTTESEQVDEKSGPAAISRISMVDK